MFWQSVLLGIQGLFDWHIANDCIGWHLTLPLGKRGVSFLAEEIAGWPFDSEQDAIRAAEKFNEIAVSANLEDKTEFLFVAEVVENKSGGWWVRIERSNGDGWTPVVSDSH